MLTTMYGGRFSWLPFPPVLPIVPVGVMPWLKLSSSRYQEPAEDGSTAFPLLCSLLVTVVLVPASTLAASLDWERTEKLKERLVVPNAKL